MGEFAGLPPLGGGGLPIRQTTDTSAWALPAVEAASKGRGPEARLTSGDSGARPGSDKRRAPPSPGPRTDKIDAHTLTGPSPAFQATILELDRELRHSIARIEAAHGQDEAKAAIAVKQSQATNASERAPETGVKPDPDPDPSTPPPGMPSPPQADAAGA